MRALLLAFAIILFPGVAAAQPAGSSQQALQQMGVWGQRLVATQKPVVDSYQRCTPAMNQVMTLMKAQAQPDRDAAAPLIASLKTCMAEMKVAATQSRDAMARMEPMPKAIERQLGIDSKDLLRRSAGSIDGMVSYLEKVEELLEAGLAGDRDLVVIKHREVRASAGSAMDGQILILETLRNGLPLQTHKSMVDIRLALSRATRAIATRDPAEGNRALVDTLRTQGAAARSASAALRANWKLESRDMRAAVARLDDPRRTALITSLDLAFSTIADAGDSLAATLEPVSYDSLDEAEALRIINVASRIEIRILTAVGTLSNSVSQSN